MPQNLSVSEFEKRYGKAASEPASLSVKEFEQMYGGNMVTRAADQVLAPNNPASLLDSAVGAGRFVNEIPGAVASVYKDYGVGALKGLGGMADSAMEMVGIPRSEYADAPSAFEGANPVQSVGKSAAETGVFLAGTEAALAKLGLTKIGGFIARALTSPAGIGTGTAVYGMSKGQDPLSAVESGIIVGAGSKAVPGMARKGVEILPARLRTAVKRMFPEATEAEIAKGVVEAQEALANVKAVAPATTDVAVSGGALSAKEAIAKAQWDLKRSKLLKVGKDIGEWQGFVRPIPPSKLKPDIPDPVVPGIAPKKVDLGKQAKAEFEARKKSDLWDARTGKPIELTPEQAREAVANQPWNQKKTTAPKPEPAPKEAPKAKVTLQPELVDRIGKAISPDAAWKDLQKHGAGDGKRIPRQEAREMVDMVWSKKDPSYTSIEQWMADRRDRWESMRTRSKPKQRGAN